MQAVMELPIRGAGAPRGERGQTLVEYALILALIAMAVVLVVLALGGELTGFYEAAANCVADPPGCVL